jgi:peroxiredoxin
MATEALELELGSLAPDFALPGVCGQTWTRDDALGPNGLLVMFICNHCPYVQAILDRIVRDARDLQALGVGVVAISSNDTVAYPEDSFDAMRRLWQDKRLPFPYLLDEDQSVARAFGAVCTPDIFVYDGDRHLAYHGRIDDSWKDASAVTQRDLADAFEALLAGRRPPTPQQHSIGCSIKWRKSA